MRIIIPRMMLSAYFQYSILVAFLS